MAPNIFKFFRARKGQPLAREGLAEFLEASRHAWNTLNVEGGEVTWAHGTPTISGGGGGGDQLNHSFMPVDNGDETFDITQGVVYMGEEGTEVLPTEVEKISFAYFTHFQIKIDLSSEVPAATWEAGTSFTANTETELYYPILEFGTAGEFSTLIRRQTSDIHYHGGEPMPNYPIPEPPAGTPAVLVFNGTDLVWVSATKDYSVFQRKEDDSLGFDYVRVMT